MEASGQIHTLVASGAYWIGGWVGPIAGLDAVAKRKIPIPRRKSNSARPSR